MYGVCSPPSRSIAGRMEAIVSDQNFGWKDFVIALPNLDLLLSQLFPSLGLKEVLCGCYEIQLNVPDPIQYSDTYTISRKAIK